MSIEWLSRGKNRVSRCGRWRILHPDNSTSNLWELYDEHSLKPWHGDWPTLKSAKAAAVVAQVTE